MIPNETSQLLFFRLMGTPEKDNRLLMLYGSRGDSAQKVIKESRAAPPQITEITGPCIRRYLLCRRKNKSNSFGDELKALTKRLSDARNGVEPHLL